MMNIFRTILAMANQLRDIDPRIHYLPLSLHYKNGSTPHINAALHVDTDDAVREIAARFGLGEPTVREHVSSEWLMVDKWVEVDGVHMHLSFSGPHRRKADTATEAS